MLLEKNGNRQIETLIIKDKEVEIFFNEGERLCVTINAYVNVGPFSKGQILEEDIINDIIYNDKLDRMLEYSYQLLAKRMYSCSKLRSLLAKKCDDNDILSNVISKLIEKGYLNDLEYALNKAKSFFDKNKGFEFIAVNLSNDGISEEIINIVRNNYSSKYEQIKAIETAKKLWKSQSGKSHQQKLVSIYSTLIQRGYNEECSEQAVNTLRANYDHENEISSALKELNRLIRKYGKPNTSKMVYNKIYQGLMAKGYRSGTINEVLKEVEIDD